MLGFSVSVRGWAGAWLRVIMGQHRRRRAIPRGVTRSEGKTMLPRLLLTLVFLVPAGAHAQSGSSDPLEKINRSVFVFNDYLDRGLLKPVATGYDKVLPKPAKTGVTNFFSNLFDVNRAFNSLLQGQVRQAGRSASRVLVNSTIGMFGFFDVATDMGVARHRTDFGQTLAVWGVPEGPFIMVPLLGPRTMRSGTGLVFDTLTSVNAQLDNVRARNTLFFTGIVNDRALLLGAEQIMSGDRYIFMRDAYLQQRRSLISGGEIQDDFSDYEDDWEEEF